MKKTIVVFLMLAFYQFAPHNVAHAVSVGDKVYSVCFVDSKDKSNFQAHLEGNKYLAEMCVFVQPCSKADFKVHIEKHAPQSIYSSQTYSFCK